MTGARHPLPKTAELAHWPSGCWDGRGDIGASFLSGEMGNHGGRVNRLSHLLNLPRAPYRLSHLDRDDCSSLVTRSSQEIGSDTGDSGEEPDQGRPHDLARLIGAKELLAPTLGDRVKYVIPAATIVLFVASLTIAPAHATASPDKPVPPIRQTRHPGHSPTHPPTRSPARPSAPSPRYAVNAKPHRSPDSYPWGQCTWGAAALAHDDVDRLGDAEDWLANAQARGMPTGLIPRAGATVVFQPGVQGASSLGHVAHVIAVYPDGSFLIEEMNYYGYGGGFGAWSTRVAYPGWGVSFIY